MANGLKRYTNEEIIEALTATKGLVFLAARRLGCKPDTIYARIKSVAEVSACLKAQRGEVLDTGELSLYNAVVRGESWAVQFLLKTLGKKRGYTEEVKPSEQAPFYPPPPAEPEPEPPA